MVIRSAYVKDLQVGDVYTYDFLKGAQDTLPPESRTVVRDNWQGDYGSWSVQSSIPGSLITHMKKLSGWPVLIDDPDVPVSTSMYVPTYKIEKCIDAIEATDWVNQYIGEGWELVSVSGDDYIVITMVRFDLSSE